VSRSSSGSRQKRTGKPGRKPGREERTLELAREYGDVCTTYRYTNHHGLIRALVPFGFQVTDPVDMLTGVSAVIEDLPETSATFGVGDVDEKCSQSTNYPFQTTIFRLAGAFQTDVGGEGRRQAWANPNYLHKKSIGNITDRDARIRYCRTVGRLGAVSGADVAPRFGLTHGSFGTWCNRHGVPWQSWRNDGIVRLARTLLLVTRWTDHSENELADALPLPNGTVRSFIQRFGRESEWTVPDDPTGEIWFRNSNVAEASTEIDHE